MTPQRERRCSRYGGREHVRDQTITSNAATHSRRLLSSFALADLCAVANAQTVGSPALDPPIDDSCSGGPLYIDRGSTQPVAGPSTQGNRTFFDNEPSTQDDFVTPVLLEFTGAIQWTLVAISTPRASTAVGA